VDAQPVPRSQDASGIGPRPLRVSSSELFHGQRQIVIVHGDEEYRLHITKTGKLILTK
jgi:hemin uptake protein HemP